MLQLEMCDGAAGVVSESGRDADAEGGRFFRRARGRSDESPSPGCCGEGHMVQTPVVARVLAAGRGSHGAGGLEEGEHDI